MIVVDDGDAIANVRKTYERMDGWLEGCFGRVLFDPNTRCNVRKRPVLYLQADIVLPFSLQPFPYLTEIGIAMPNPKK